MKDNVQIMAIGFGSGEAFSVQTTPVIYKAIVSLLYDALGDEYAEIKKQNAFKTIDEYVSKHEEGEDDDTI